MKYRHGLQDKPVLGTNKGIEARPGFRGMAPVEEGVLPKWFRNLDESLTGFKVAKEEILGRIWAQFQINTASKPDRGFRPTQREKKGPN
jgi:hypothetical protein